VPRLPDVGLEPAAKNDLVDLDAFEPSTSSMPFKKYQSLAGILTKKQKT
jgi:hypothetical protein